MRLHSLAKQVIAAAWLSCAVLGVVANSDGKSPRGAAITPMGTWEIASYNFGALLELTPEEQIAELRRHGYDALTLRVAEAEDFENLPLFLATAARYDDFRIHAAFVRYNFEDEAFKERWTEVVDAISGRNIQLWVVFGKPVDGYDDSFVARKLRKIISYSEARDVQVVLYPHSSTYFETVEEAMPLVEQFEPAELTVAFHLYHEIRGRNGHRIAEVLERVKTRLGAVTLAGTDTDGDHSSSRTLNDTTIMPLGEGTYDMEELIRALYRTNYTEPISIMNFKLTAPLDDYLPTSRKLLQQYIENNRP
jgi:sugar phosphate isomerase/epimerase